MNRPSVRWICGAGIAIAVAASPTQAQPSGVPAAVEHLLQGFASESCARRWQAAEEYTDRMIGRVLKYEEPPEEVAARLRARAPLAGTVVENRVRQIAAFVDEFKASFERLEKDAATVDRSGTKREVWRALLRPLTKVLDDPGEAFMTRWLAASVVASTVRKSDSARAAGWSQPLPRLLQSRDAGARLLGSIVAAMGGLLEDQAPTKGQVIPTLILGLDADPFAARYESQRALLEVTELPVDRFCVDPSDGPVDRAAGVQRWQAWWEQNKARLSREKIQQ